jgi:hypothetical protein
LNHRVVEGAAPAKPIQAVQPTNGHSTEISNAASASGSHS